MTPNVVAVAMEDAVVGSLDLPSSRELGALFQDEFSASTGLAVRWAAERLQGNRAGLMEWAVPFNSEAYGRGRFELRWDPEIARSLSLRLGASAARPEFLGAILRAAAGRWASWQTMRAGASVRLQPSTAEDSADGETAWRSSAVLMLDALVLEVRFYLEPSAKP